ncbi:CYFA0S12e01838g1_1 [Cyberlindnera fabianii]|uniref:CYFA0S12e01838g1_1 n=1 Tax=Cyberlindnera fabianii TaxID=36022 RepID=A0A061B1A2_CYBFA|nr:CYFA0S12e01838g1_1 [Cyberlindnera fabianii]
MQFSIAILSVAALAVAQNITTSIVDAESTVLATVTECASTVTDCPAKNGSNVTVPSVTTFEGAANNMYAGAGVAAAAAIAAFML